MIISTFLLFMTDFSACKDNNNLSLFDPKHEIYLFALGIIS